MWFALQNYFVTRPNWAAEGSNLGASTSTLVCGLHVASVFLCLHNMISSNHIYGCISKVVPMIPISFPEVVGHPFLSGHSNAGIWSVAVLHADHVVGIDAITACSLHRSSEREPTLRFSFLTI